MASLPLSLICERRDTRKRIEYVFLDTGNGVVDDTLRRLGTVGNDVIFYVTRHDSTGSGEEECEVLELHSIFLLRSVGCVGGFRTKVIFESKLSKE